MELFKRLTDEAEELSELIDVFKPVMHTILLIWTYSQYYNTPARLVVLIREICNAIINRCRASIDGR
jgi:dynein heavy chain